MNKMSIDLKVGETLTIGAATVRLEQKSGQLARLVIVADDATPITPPKARRNTASEARMSALLRPSWARSTLNEPNHR